MESGWVAVLQAIIIAVSAWYVRKGSKDDATNVIRSSAAQSTSVDILARVKKVELDMEIVKLAALENRKIDDRGPRRT